MVYYREHNITILFPINIINTKVGRFVCENGCYSLSYDILYTDRILHSYDLHSGVVIPKWPQYNTSLLRRGYSTILISISPAINRRQHYHSLHNNFVCSLFRVQTMFTLLDKHYHISCQAHRWEPGAMCPVPTKCAFVIISLFWGDTHYQESHTVKEST